MHVWAANEHLTCTKCALVIIMKVLYIWQSNGGSAETINTKLKQAECNRGQTAIN